MNDLAADLRAQREASGLSLQDLFERTRINPDFLKAIESGNFSVLPDPYVRLFLKRYAQEIGFNSREILDRYDAIPKSLAPVARPPSLPPARSRRGPVLAVTFALVLTVGIGAFTLRNRLGSRTHEPVPVSQVRSLDKLAPRPQPTEPAPALSSTPSTVSAAETQQVSQTTGPTQPEPDAAHQPPPETKSAQPKPDAAHQPPPESKPAEPKTNPTQQPASETKPAQPKTDAAQQPTSETKPAQPKTEAAQQPASETKSAQPKPDAAHQPPPETKPAQPKTEAARQPASETKPIQPKTNAAQQPPPETKPTQPKTNAVQSPETQSSARAERPQSRPESPAQLASEAATSQEGVPSPAQPGRVIAAYSLATGIPLDAPDSLMTLTGDATSNVQMVVTADGKRIFDSTLAGGSSHNWTARKRFRVEIQNAPAVSLSLQGHRLKPMGGPGLRLRLFISRASIWVEEIQPTGSDR